MNGTPSELARSIPLAPGDRPDRVEGWLMLPDPDQGVRLVPGRLRFAPDGRIARVEPDGALRHARTLITPAFIDAHLHLPQFDSIGVAGLELLHWLDTVIFPAEARWNDPRFAADMARRAAHDLLSVGTVTVAAWATSHAPAANAALHALADAGLAGFLGVVLMDRHAPDALLRPAQAALADAAALEPARRISPSLAPRFALTCSPELLAGAARLARDRGWLVQTHLAESKAELARLATLFPGHSSIDVYHDAGLLGPRTLFAHAIWLSDADRKRLAAAGAAVVHCPSANRFLNAGAMDLAATLASVIPTAVGSDLAGGPDRAMPRVARALAETAVALGKPPVPAGRCFAAITHRNADALGLVETARLMPGSWGDVLLINPRHGWIEHPDPLGGLLYGWDDRWLTATLAAGRVVWTS